MMTNGSTESSGSDTNEQSVGDIEDVVPDEKRLANLDKMRGFMKYKRATYQYRKTSQRQHDWDEIYNHKEVMDGLRVQAAR